MSGSAAQTTILDICIINGTIIVVWIFLVYTGASVALEYFFITSITFGAMSLYGYTTKRDLN